MTEELKDRDAPKILVIRFSSLGDLILLDPMLKEIKRGYPRARIDLVTKREYSILFAPSPAITDIHLLEGPGLGNLYSLFRRLRNEKYDIIVDAHNVIRSIILSFFLLAGKKVRIKKHHAKKVLLIKGKQNLYSSSIHIKDQYLDLAKELGIDLSGKEHFLSLPDEAIRISDDLIEASTVSGTIPVAIAPGARWDTKRWPVEYFSELASRLDGKGYGIILIGDGSESPLCGRIARSIGKVLDSSGRLSVLETAALLKRCALLVTNDSAPLHLAESVGTPVVALFGPTVKEFGFYPRMEKSRALETDLDCRPCSRNGSVICKFGTIECLRKIQVEEVFVAAIDVIEGSRVGGKEKEIGS
ncbi:MAG: glycosyltransferase family 9 protein [Candidatus Krumholzibacteriota bacterium]|nr:glycosyltransferase family 9 protein [Candidatus Krumholzibacteriota bacterium]